MPNSQKGHLDWTGIVVKNTLAEIVKMQQIAGNPLTEEEIAMFEMFEREGWSSERCRRHIAETLRREKTSDK